MNIRSTLSVDRSLAIQAIILLVVSIGFESLFIHYGLNSMDEGWPLHAAMELHEGKTLYEEVFWVFPPGHLLPAWIGYAVQAPGVVATRIIYSSFSVALCLSLFFTARRLMPPDFAFLAGLMVAIAAPTSHWEHLLFGYRYLVWSVIVLLCFHRRLTRDDPRWLFVAGIFAGIALFFRLTPAFAVSVAIGVGIVASSRDWRRWLRDGLGYSAGLVLIWIPILLWFNQSVGLERFWSEMVLRPVEMTALQSKPIPPLALGNGTRPEISFAFGALGFRLYALLYVGFVAALLYRWGRALWERRPFEQAFLLSFVVFGGVYFARSMGRSDIPHLDSAIPPVVVLLAYCASLAIKPLGSGGDESGSRRVLWGRILCVCVFGLWAFLNGADRYLSQESSMGRVPMVSTSGTVKVGARSRARIVDNLVESIQMRSGVDEPILVMTTDPILHVLADRHGPGYHDLVMPGTFRSSEEERAFLERLDGEPPAVIVWPRQHFDRMPSRGLDASAPGLKAWVIDRYRPVGRTPLHSILVPKDEPTAETNPAKQPPER